MLGKNVRARRERLGLTQEQLAERAGLHWTFVSGIERGLRNVSLLKLIDIAHGLQIRLTDLFVGIE